MRRWWLSPLLGSGAGPATPSIQTLSPRVRPVPRTLITHIPDSVIALTSTPADVPSRPTRLVMRLCGSTTSAPGSRCRSGSPSSSRPPLLAPYSSRSHGLVTWGNKPGGLRAPINRQRAAAGARTGGRPVRPRRQGSAELGESEVASSSAALPALRGSLLMTRAPSSRRRPKPPGDRVRLVGARRWR